jgi:hypothetical protein
MKPLLLLFVTFTLLLACNLDKNRKLSEQEKMELAKAHNDSVTVIVDSLLKTNIYIPPLYDKDIFDSATTEKFYELTRSTEGDLKLLVNSKLITTEIVNILKSNATDNADLLVLIDKTGSMADDIVNIKEGLNQIIDVLKTFKNIRLAIALYGDKNEDGPDWFSFRNFETNYTTAKEFIGGIQVTGGGDYPESVYEGFFSACDQNFWRSADKRMIILIGDAPPLEKPLSNYGVTDLIKKANENSIKMNFYPIVVTPVVAAGTTETGVPNSPLKTFEKEKIITSVLPNPASTTINISMTTNDIYTVEIYNASGVFISGDKFSGNLWKRDISSLQNGAYIARIISHDKKYEAVKFIVYK